MRSLTRVVAPAALLAILTVPSAVRAGGDWNDKQIDWQPYAKGLETAKAKKKPVCLVFYTEWCPHCQNFSGVFHDGKVVEKSKKFVMIRIDKDKEADLSRKFVPDGEYIPRTYFLSPAGTLEPSIHAPRDKYQYFYDEHEPAPLLAAMDTALEKFK
jgi:thiol-disulfide isomerase/thioredoxin